MELLTAWEATEAATTGETSGALLEEHLERMTTLSERIAVSTLLTAHGVIRVVTCIVSLPEPFISEHTPCFVDLSHLLL